MEETLNGQIIEQVNGEMVKISQVGTDPDYLLEYRKEELESLEIYITLTIHCFHGYFGEQ